MVILINGAFGVGKTTIARQLVSRIPESILFNPEIIGFVLRRLPKFVYLSGRGTDDYQDLRIWRRLTAAVAKTIHQVFGRTVVIPMAFSNLEYLDQLRSEFEKKEIQVRHFCLTAPVEIVHKRLEKRGVSFFTAEGKWVYPKAAKCCEIHASSEFSEHIATENRLPDEIVKNILNQLSRGTNDV